MDVAYEKPTSSIDFQNFSSLTRHILQLGPADSNRQPWLERLDQAQTKRMGPGFSSVRTPDLYGIDIDRHRHRHACTHSTFLSSYIITLSPTRVRNIDCNMSWQGYVDTNLVGTGKISQAAIIGLKGGVWATSPDFNVSIELLERIRWLCENVIDSISGTTT